MILVDTSVIVAWLDPKHPAHGPCTRALDGCAAIDELGISAVTLAELASSGRSPDAIAQDLDGFIRVPLNEESALCAGCASVRLHSGSGKLNCSFADSLILGQAAALKVPLLTLKLRNLRAVKDVDILLPMVQGRGSVD
jgi:predicted nucleic acid-binding protein